MSIDLKNISQDKIKEDLRAYLTSSSNWENIETKLTASTVEQLLNLISSFAVYETYKYRANKNENYIDEAVLDSSVMRLARLLGYRYNRRTAPRIKVRYSSPNTITLTDGTVIGSYNNYDVIYFGPTKFYESGDIFDVYIGKFNEYTFDTNTHYLTYEILPELLHSVDNNAVHVYANNIPQSVSRNIEDFVIFQKVVDFSRDGDIANLFIRDMDNYFGIDVPENVTITVKWIETDGYEQNLVLKDIHLAPEYIPLEISSVGTNGDDIEKVRFIAPLYFSTLRRMVTTEDHEYLIKSHELIKDCSAIKEADIPYKANITCDAPTSVGETYTVTLFGTDYTVQSEAGDDAYSITQKLYVELINASQYMAVEWNSNNNWIMVTQVYFNTCAYNTCDFQLTSTPNINIDVTQTFQKAPCCTIISYYVKHNVVDDPIVLTSSEQSQLADFINQYKMVGTRIVLQPANRENYQLSIKVSLTDTAYQTQVQEAIESIVKSYELDVNRPFYYGEFLARASQSTVYDNGRYMQVIDYIIPNQTVFDLPAKVDTYYTFDLDIQFIEPES